MPALDADHGRELGEADDEREMGKLVTAVIPMFW